MTQYAALSDIMDSADRERERVARRLRWADLAEAALIQMGKDYEEDGDLCSERVYSEIQVLLAQLENERIPDEPTSV